jgi:hypothetical protein
MEGLFGALDLMELTVASTLAWTLASFGAFRLEGSLRSRGGLALTSTFIFLFSLSKGWYARNYAS